MQYISEEQFELELPTSRAMLATTRPSCVYSLSACNAVYIVFVQPVDYWPVVGKFAETLELSYLDTRHRLWEEAETLSALAGLSVVSTTSSSQPREQCIRWGSVHRPSMNQSLPPMLHCTSLLLPQLAKTSGLKLKFHGTVISDNILMTSSRGCL